MKILNSLLVLLFMVSLSVCVHSDTTWVEGTIINQTWELSGSPYCVIGDIFVAGIIIEPGVTVEFWGNFGLTVGGVITAVGTYQDSVVFTKNATIDGWQGVYFDQSVPGSELAYCVIEGSLNSGIRLNQSDPIIRNCLLLNNMASGEYGGGIYATNCDLTISDCLIESNSVSSSGNSYGGGLFVNGDAIITNCVIVNNSISAEAHYRDSRSEGGGVYVEGTSMITNCIIRGNTVYSYADGYQSPYTHRYATSKGGGIYVHTSSLIKNCIISNNFVSAAAPGGHGHPSYSGSGVSVESGTANIINCNIIENNVNGIKIDGDTSLVANSIIWDNGSDQIAGSAVVSYSNVQGGFSGEGNINYNPIFLSDSTLIIVLGSPCIDAGNANSIYNDISFPPSLETERNDIGAHGGPDACIFKLQRPRLIFPVNDTSISDYDITSMWSNDVDAESYMVQLSQSDSLFLNPLTIITNENLCSFSDMSNGIWYWRVKALYENEWLWANGWGAWSDISRFIVEHTGVDNTNRDLPLDLVLSQNTPNPFNSCTSIQFRLPEPSHVKIIIFDISGRKIKTLVNQNLAAGYYKTDWDAKGITSGVYFYRIYANDCIDTKKMLVLK